MTITEQQVTEARAIWQAYVNTLPEPPERTREEVQEWERLDKIAVDLGRAYREQKRVASIVSLAAHTADVRKVFPHVFGEAK